MSAGCRVMDSYGWRAHSLINHGHYATTETLSDLHRLASPRYRAYETWSQGLGISESGQNPST